MLWLPDSLGGAEYWSSVTLHTMLNTSDNLLHVGVSQAPITPPVGFAICGPEFPDRPARSVYDDLMVRCAVFRSYGETAVIVSLDIWSITDSLREEFARMVEEVSGISRRNVLIVSTGNGTSPPLWRDGADLASGYRNYVAYLPDVVAGAVLNAAQSLEPVAVGTVAASLPNLSCFANPAAEEDLEAERETLMLTAVQDADGDIVCILYSFACPATIMGDTDAWTADYPGIASSALEQSGIGAAIFIQGASADVRPFDWWDGNKDITHADRTWEDAQALGILLATQTIRAVSNVVVRRNARVGMADSDDGEVSALRIGDAVLVSSRNPQPVEFASRIRALLPESKVIVSANSRGDIKRPTNVGSMAVIKAIRSRIYP